MNSKIFVSIALILSIVTCAILGTVNASAFEQQEINLSAANSTQSYVTMDDTNYLYREVEPNDSIATANIRISQGNQRINERVLIGYVSQSDPADYYEIYVRAGTTYKIKLTPVGDNNLDLYLYNSSGALVSQSKSTQTGISEHITNVQCNDIAQAVHQGAEHLWYGELPIPPFCQRNGDGKLTCAITVSADDYKRLFRENGQKMSRQRFRNSCAHTGLCGKILRR